MLRAAMRALGASPPEAVMVGDRRSVDVAAGRTAGVVTVWIRSEDGGGPDPDHEIASVGDLPELLLRIEGGER
jgi:FMN phosphatase YigB (HAD superfamily)